MLTEYPIIATKILYLKQNSTLDGTKGLEIYNFIFTAVFFLGMIISICLVFFSSSSVGDYGFYGISLVVGFITIIYIIIDFININVLPAWFEKKEGINQIFITNYYKKGRIN